MSLTLLLIILGVVILLALFRPATLIGKLGEANVARRLKALPKSDYTVFNNLLIQRSGYSSQIDHVVVSKYGVFVIETKNYKGMVYGGEFTEHWTQNIWGNKYQLYNPIQQNKGHVKALKSYLGVQNFPFISIIAFSSRATVKVHAKESFVMYFSDVTRFIKRQNIVLLSDDDLQNTIQMLRKLPKFRSKDKRKHIEQARFQEYKSQKAIFNKKCPRCGGDLIYRTGRYGNFYGCSNYPRCKFTSK